MSLIKQDLKSIAETIDGVTYRVAPLPMSGIGRLQRVLDRTPYPKDTANVLARLESLRAAGSITDDEAKEHRREAIAEEMAWPAELIFDPRARGVFTYDDAARASFLAVALDPPPADAAAMAISLTIPPGQFMRVFGAAFALDDEESAKDPKGGGSDTTGGSAASTTTTSP